MDAAASADPASALSPTESPAPRYTDILSDLLWSSQLVLASRNRPRLMEVIPGVLRTLREGRDAIDYPREQTEAFFQALRGLQEAAYKTQCSEAASDNPPGRQFDVEQEPEYKLQRHATRASLTTWPWTPSRLSSTRSPCSSTGPTSTTWRTRTF